MEKSEQEAIEANKAEMESLGLEPSPADEETKGEEIISPEIVAAEKAETKAEPEAKAKEEAKVEPEKVEPSKQVSIRDLKKGYKETIAKLEAEVATLKANPTVKQEEKVETLKISIEDQAKKLAEKLNFDPEKTRAILEAARESILGDLPKNETLSPEDKEAIETVKNQKIALEQQEIFNEEWNDVETTLKTQFPNAKPEQLAKAKATMKELAYDDKYVDKEMEYILFKEKEVFDTALFSPKQKTFESGKAPQVVFAEDGELEDFNPEWSISQVEAWEKKRDSLIDAAPKSKVRITSRGVERWEEA